MDYAQDYLDDILVRIAYHSSGIEGNTISLPETVSIILEKSIIVMFNIANTSQRINVNAYTYFQNKNKKVQKKRQKS
ncbi:hypothetical protein [Streptococcus pneumoniae]|uniref:hypothetical protein n=1 Tax=Streptococcus pneumoniae TaxID=1313 RepID=UPI000B594C65|nr:hypothetical protein [Streptococcus pneumoniae]SNJ24960.1 Fic protein family [Streptococcus pneumoniae]SNL86339.1 Fic protein family [Streptococcus pneumoniae]